MRPETMAIFAFVVSLVSYGWIGWLWYLYDTYFGMANYTSITFLNEAWKIQAVGFAAFLGAVGTALVVYNIERQ